MHPPSAVFDNLLDECARSFVLAEWVIMNQIQFEGIPASDIIRVDRAVSYKDRNSRMWAGSLLYRKGLMILMLDEEGNPHVVFADDLGKHLSVPLHDARYLGDAPPSFGSKRLAEHAIRVAFGDARRIIHFTGDMSEYDDLNQEVALARITGDPEPSMIVKGIQAFGRLPGIRREQRNAKSAWIAILTEVTSAK
jgi:hypothetical protein